MSLTLISVNISWSQGTAPGFDSTYTISCALSDGRVFTASQSNAAYNSLYADPNIDTAMRLYVNQQLAQQYGVVAANFNTLATVVNNFPLSAVKVPPTGVGVQAQALS